MDTGKVFLGALAGLATGAILGILFAPDKGSNTRKKITDKGRDAVGDLKTKYNDVIDSLTSKLENAKKDGMDFYEDGMDLAQNTKNHIQKSIK